MSVLRSYLSCHQQPPLANAPDHPPPVDEVGLVQEPILPKAVPATSDKVRILTGWADLNDLEKKVFTWLKAHGLVEPYHVAAGLSLSLDTVQQVLEVFDRFCLILKCDHQIALTLSAKQRFIESEAVAATNDPRIVAIEADALALGWSHDQLWKQTPFWPEKVLVDILRPNQVITAVTASAIRLEETNGQGEVVVQHFYNPKAPQPWVTSKKLLHS